MLFDKGLGCCLPCLTCDSLLPGGSLRALHEALCGITHTIKAVGCITGNAITMWVVQAGLGAFRVAMVRVGTCLAGAIWWHVKWHVSIPLRMPVMVPGFSALLLWISEGLSGTCHV